MGMMLHFLKSLLKRRRRGLGYFLIALMPAGCQSQGMGSSFNCFRPLLGMAS